MPKLLEVYKCEHCGNIVEIVHGGVRHWSVAARNEAVDGKHGRCRQGKHVPVIEISDGVVKVTVGSVPHPMEEKHYIEWIELVADGKVYRQALKPGDAPTATFNITASSLTAGVVQSPRSLDCQSLISLFEIHCGLVRGVAAYSIALRAEGTPRFFARMYHADQPTHGDFKQRQCSTND